MNEQQVTQWFSGYLTPEHVGIYQKMIYNQVAYSRWNGEFWESYFFNETEADLCHNKSFYQDAEWRGIAKE